MRESPRPTPYGYTIFCDDVRAEVLNKHSYMGIYPGQLVVGSPIPTALPKLCLVIYYFERPGESDEPVHFTIHVPGDDPATPTARLEIPTAEFRITPLANDPEADDPLLAFTAILTLAPLEVKQAGRLKIRAQRGDLEIRLGSLLITDQTPAS